ncbi:MAG: hypothetical protein F6K23_17380 [Okeania sp. SIO2C9]|uniref:hypothetical protein n=1 Tax=Okeania sp. SIO2C9 TaxID=2607791 RepID=UPI0013C03DD7|nr:hypothetical protein [Okeania sp. SIO2C9]NEQ74657.1 hypothetical protein [Okeania sp. SIO2C9]
MGSRGVLGVWGMWRQFSTFFSYYISLAPDSVLLCQKLVLRANIPNGFHRKVEKKD